MSCFEGYNAAILAYGQTGSKYFVSKRWKDIYNGYSNTYTGKLEPDRYRATSYQLDIFCD
jgi:hypothetical protein